MAAKEIINLESSSEEDGAQLGNKENSNQEEEEEGEIQEEGFIEIGSGDDPSEQDMDLGDDVVVPKQSVLHASAEVVSGGPTSTTVMKSSTDIVFTDQTCILFARS
jgi:hypothetical protein